MDPIAMAHFFGEVKCRCVNCSRNAYIYRSERTWTCYACGRINETKESAVVLDTKGFNPSVNACKPGKTRKSYGGTYYGPNAKRTP